jgi:hypothetical protein
VHFFQPRLPVGIVERHSARHLVDVRRRMQVVGIDESPLQALGDRSSDSRLAGAGDSHQNGNHGGSGNFLFGRFHIASQRHDRPNCSTATQLAPLEG